MNRTFLSWKNEVLGFISNTTPPRILTKSMLHEFRAEQKSLTNTLKTLTPPRLGIFLAKLQRFTQKYGIKTPPTTKPTKHEINEWLKGEKK